MRVLACGCRTYTNRWAIHAMLDHCIPDPMVSSDVLTIIEGGAKGADKIAKVWACGDDPEKPCPAGSHRALLRPYVVHEPYPADWEKYGKAAGPIRNKQMLVEGKPDLVLAFVDRPLGDTKGTANMVKQAKAVPGLPVYVIEAS